MKHTTTSESDVTSMATTSPPRTPKRPAYYVQSPSRDGSHDDGDKSSTAHTTPVYNNSPLESPSHPSSTGRHSRISSVTRFSATLRSPASPASCGRAAAGGRRKRLGSKQGWREVAAAIDEEGAYDDELDEEPELPRCCVAAFWLSAVILAFTVICLIVWGAARQYKPSVLVKSLTVHNFYAGEGTDRTGVPTKLVTLNCSLRINVHNPSTMFGIHVSSSSVRLMYSEIAIANGRVTSISVNIHHQIPCCCACSTPYHQTAVLCSAVRQVLPAEDQPPRRLRDPARREDPSLRSRRHACSVQRRRQGAIDARAGRQNQRICDGQAGEGDTREAYEMLGRHRSRQLQASKAPSERLHSHLR
ncbi:unnamed protein product [Urochloa decumbens]|uniref:Late embryogenesis abundant protein LEA-2 subgroup domain-containing protein n=1 Tax=Urochloa decumbens TaxID=240449 RepID=A0ABC9AJ65_9POAL